MVVPGWVCSYLEQLFDLSSLRKRQRGQNTEFDDVLMAMHTAHLLTQKAEVERLTSGMSGSAIARQAEVRSPSSVMSCSQVADAADCTNRAVRLAATSGRLVGTKNGEGRWVFAADDVAAWTAARTARTKN